MLPNARAAIAHESGRMFAAIGGSLPPRATPRPTLSDRLVASAAERGDASVLTQGRWVSAMVAKWLIADPELAAERYREICSLGAARPSRCGEHVPVPDVRRGGGMRLAHRARARRRCNASPPRHPTSVANAHSTGCAGSSRVRPMRRGCASWPTRSCHSAMSRRPRTFVWMTEPTWRSSTNRARAPFRLRSDSTTACGRWNGRARRSPRASRHSRTRRRRRMRGFPRRSSNDRPLRAAPRGRFARIVHLADSRSGWVAVRHRTTRSPSANRRRATCGCTRAMPPARTSCCDGRGMNRRRRATSRRRRYSRRGTASRAVHHSHPWIGPGESMCARRAAVLRDSCSSRARRRVRCSRRARRAPAARYLSSASLVDGGAQRANERHRGVHARLGRAHHGAPHHHAVRERATAAACSGPDTPNPTHTGSCVALRSRAIVSARPAGDLAPHPRHSQPADEIDESAAVARDLRHARRWRGGRDEADEGERALADARLELRIAAHGKVGDEYTADPRGRGARRTHRGPRRRSG